MNRADKVQNNANKKRAEKRQERIQKNKEALEIELKQNKKNKKETFEIKKKLKKLDIATGINEVEIKVLDEKLEEPKAPKSRKIKDTMDITGIKIFVFAILAIAVFAALFIGNT